MLGEKKRLVEREKNRLCLGVARTTKLDSTTMCPANARRRREYVKRLHAQQSTTVAASRSGISALIGRRAREHDARYCSTDAHTRTERIFAVVVAKLRRGELEQTIFKSKRLSSQAGAREDVGEALC